MLLSGRWFRAPASSGPWTFATPDLPKDFRNIPQDAPYQAVRSSIPGTPESAEARLKASIPTTARVQTGSVTPDCRLCGGCPVRAHRRHRSRYATNTSSTVIRVGDRYFLLQDGVWFVADNPNGPWQIAREVPRRSTRSRPPRRSTTHLRAHL